jgi:hypothetical protein
MERTNIIIEIQSQQEGLPSEIMEGPKKLDIKADLPGHAVIMKVHSSIDAKKMFLLSFGTNIAPGLIANWLYEKINGRATELRIDRIDVQINKGEIERIITEKIGK